jgi:hypothetical protein
MFFAVMMACFAVAWPPGPWWDPPVSEKKIPCS